MDTDNQDVSKVIAAVCYVNKTIGFACYDELLNTIFADSVPVSFEDMEDVLAKIKSASGPTLFLIHPTILANSSLLDLLICGIDGTPNAYRHASIKSSAWNPDAALELMCSKLIISANDSSSGEVQSSRQSYLRLVAAIDIESQQLKQSMGALLCYLQSNVFIMDDGMISVSDVKQLDLVSYLRIDAGSIRALQIFAQEQHPEVVKGVGRSKEGFSLFGLFDRTKSLPGRQCLRDWMLKPFCDKERITHRQNGIALVVRPINIDFISDISKLMRKIHDIPRILLRIKKVEATQIEWCRLYSSLEAALPILDIIGTFLNDTENRAASDRDYIESILSDVNLQSIQSVFEMLQSSIDFQSSMETGATTIKDGYDSQLDHTRNIYDSLETFLTQAAHQILETVPLLQNISVEYVPQIGYLVAVSNVDALLLQPYSSTSNKRKRSDHESDGDNFLGNSAGTERDAQINPSQLDDDKYDDVVYTDNDYVDNEMNDSNSQDDELSRSPEDEGFQFIYAQGDSCYYKHKIVLKLDDTIGDVQSSIIDRQRSLLLEIEDILLDAEVPLQQMAAMLKKVDAIISLGVIATEMDFVRPEIVEESVIIIKEGRHLLQELTVEGAFVPNDTFINTSKNIALITGPNSSGKSVYLKQVGLLVYLAHIGSWLPCTNAVIGLTDRIMTRITSFESVAAAQSSFSLDLGQVAKMLKVHTSRTLCLIDEFGKGTTPVDGIALLATTVRHFAISKAKVIFVLHFTEILHPAILGPAVMECVNTFRMETHKPIRQSIDEGLSSDEDAGDEDFADNLDQSSLSRRSNGFSNNDQEEPMPLFRLKLGVAPSSDGIICARNAGVSKEALERAFEVKDAILNKRPIRALASLDKNMLLGDEKHRNLLSIFIRTLNWEKNDERIPGEGSVQVGDFGDRVATEMNEDPLASFMLLLR